MNDRPHDEAELEGIDDDFEGLGPEDFDIEPLAGLLPELTAADLGPAPDGPQDDPVEGLGSDGIPKSGRSWREAVQIALEKVRTGATTEVGMCLKRTREYYGVGPLYSAAKLSLAGAQRLGKAYQVGFEDVDRIPRGAVVYWTGPNSQYGHVAISLGGGMCVSTDVPRGRFGKINIATLARAWGYTAIFWSPLVNDVRVWAPRRPVPVNLKRVPGVWEFLADETPGRIRPHSHARVLVRRDAGSKFFPERAVKHDGHLWLQGRDGHWYRRSDAQHLHPLADDKD